MWTKNEHGDAHQWVTAVRHEKSTRNSIALALKLHNTLSQEFVAATSQKTNSFLTLLVPICMSDNGHSHSISKMAAEDILQDQKILDTR